MKNALPTRKDKADWGDRRSCNAANDEDRCELLTPEELEELLDKLDILLADFE